MIYLGKRIAVNAEKKNKQTIQKNCVHMFVLPYICIWVCGGGARSMSDTK